jgi:hypothetical protein
MAVASLLDPAGVNAEAVLGAMRAVALEHGGPGLIEMERSTSTRWRRSTRPGWRELCAAYGVPPVDPTMLA